MNVGSKYYEVMSKGSDDKSGDGEAGISIDPKANKEVGDLGKLLFK